MKRKVELPKRFDKGKRPVELDKKKFECDVCGKVFTLKYRLQRHSQVHTDVCSFKCDLCPYKGKRREYLLYHIKNIHSKPKSNKRVKQYPCDICGKAFPKPSSLRTHKFIHTGVKPYRCDTCGKGFSTASSLKAHNFIHTGVKPYRCDTCGKGFSTASSLNAHNFIHTGVTPYRCDTCGKGFSTASSLKAHNFIHTGVTPYQCDTCGKGLSTASSLKDHNFIHTGEKPYQCTFCDYACRDKSSLRKHKARHHAATDSIYNCKSCDKRFTSENLLSAHTKTHGVMREEFICDTCGYVTYHKNNIRRHVNRIHRNEQVVRCKLPKVVCKKPPNLKKHCSEDNQQRQEKTEDVVDVKMETIVTEPVATVDSLSPIIIDGGNKTEKSMIEDKLDDQSGTGVQKSSKGNVAGATPGRGLKLNFHQCSICFKLFSTKRHLLAHCKHHFDVCSETVLTRCPICRYVTNKDVNRHMREKHGLDLNIPFSRIKEKRNSNGSTRYCFEVDNTVLEVIPSVRNLKKFESMMLDKKRSESGDMFVEKTKPVKRGDGWTVEKVEIVKQECVSPVEISHDNNDEYVEKIGGFSRRGKNEGKIFPSNAREKKRQTLCGLKLNFKRHEDNPKGYKTKRRKRKGKIEEEKISMVNSNTLKRLKGECDKSLIKFYKNNIRDGDDEFWQLLKMQQDDPGE